MVITEEQKQEIENFNNIRQSLLLATPDSQALFAHFFNQGVQNGLDHSVPSKKTMEELSNIKVNQARHEEKLDSIKDTLAGHISKEDETFERLEKIVANFMENTEQKFAGKWLETLVVRLGWLVMAPLVGGALYGVWQMVKHLALL